VGEEKKDEGQKIKRESMMKKVALKPRFMKMNHSRFSRAKE